MVSKEYTPKGNVLIVSDDTEVSVALTTALSNSGYVCTSTTGMDDTLSAFSVLEYDAVLINVTSSDGDSIELTKTIRTEYPHTAIIMITSRDRISAAMTAIEMGADDYLIKPFDVTEVLARIECVLLKKKGSENESIVCRVINGELVLDCKARRVILAGGKLKLTDTEFRLLFELVSNAGKVMEYAKLLVKVWGVQYQGSREYLYTYIRLLRRIIEPDPRRPVHIITIPRVGYRFDCLP